MKETDTALRSLRPTTQKRTDAKPFEAWPPTWRAQFKAQATNEMMEDVCAYVAKRATWIEHQQGRRTPGLIREQ